MSLDRRLHKQRMQAGRCRIALRPERVELVARGDLSSSSQPLVASTPST